MTNKERREREAQKAAKRAARDAKKKPKKQVPLNRTTTAKSGTTRSGGNTTTYSSTKTTGSKKKGRVPAWKIIMSTLAVLLVIAVVVFVILAVKYVKNYLSSSSDPTVTTVTEKERSNVAYYLVGLMGELNEDTGLTGDTEMLSLVCYDKKAGTVNVLQYPSATYLGDKENWDVDSLCEVWSKPGDLQWCDTCKRAVFDSEIKGGKHDANKKDGSYCGSKLTKKKDSSVEKLLKVFSYQYAIPIDNYYLLQQESFVKLVDLVGGIDINLKSSERLGGISYAAGIQTIDGAGALEYILGDVDDIEDDIDNLVHQRQVYVALFERLFKTDKEKLNEDVLYPLMQGSTPIRTKRENDLEDDVTLMVKLLQNLNKVNRDNITFYMLPGEPATYSGKEFYSVHKNDLCKLLNDSFNPYDTAITTEFLRMPEIGNSSKSELHKNTFSKLLVEQSGVLDTSEEE